MKREALNAAFSLLPRGNADEAMRRVMDRVQQPADLDAFEIRWAEFELDGRFVRGGVSDISDLATIIVPNSQSDPGVNLLARNAASGTPTAGTVIWDDSHEQFLWYLPFRFFGADGRVGTRLRGLLVTSRLFGEIMEMFNGEARLSQAEKRTLFQLVGGLELRKAARYDSVGYETKRAHTKTASEKLGCSGQKDLVRKTLGQMVHLMSVSESELRESDPAVELAEKFLHEDMHLVARHHRSGAKLRYFVGGPTDGRPMMMVHGMMFPVILRGISRFLERYGIRLYVPVRTGYLETRPLGALFDQGDIVEQSLREIAYVAEEEGLTSIPLIGNSLGGIVAVRLALTYPCLFSDLILMSANLARSETSGREQASHFYTGMQNLKSDTLLFKLVNLEYRKFYTDTETCRHILRKHFGGCKVDVDVLEGRYCNHAAYKMFASTYRSSIVGTAEDFRQVMLDTTSRAEALKMPLSIIHGDSDPLTTIAEVRQRFHAPRTGRDHLVKGAGHFAPASHGDEVWRAVIEACG